MSTTTERQQAKAEQRATNRVEYIRARARQARNGRELVVVACNAALAARKRLTPDAQRGMAREIAEVVERFDQPVNHKETS